MSLSQNIRNLRLQKGFTQEELASKLGVSAQAVSKWETSETYPDGTLLAPLANALDASLDVLFDCSAYTMKDLSSRIMHLIGDTPAEDRFNVVRDICWQIERGLFNCVMTLGDGYDPEEIINTDASSYILNDYGFTHVSNSSAPFFAVFPEIGNGFSEAIGDGEEMRRIFEALSSPETMRALLFIHRNEPNYVFEDRVLAQNCEIDPDNLGAVMEDLLALHVVYKREIEIDGAMTTLYFSKPSHKIIALLLFAREMNYTGYYRYQSISKSKPFLK